MNWAIIIAVLLTSQAALAATLHGTVYDLSLQEVDNAIIELSSAQSKQQLVARNGTYSFEVTPGTYKLVARTEQLAVIEDVQIPHEGTYIVDLILVDTFEDLEQLLLDLEDTSAEEPYVEETTTYTAWYVVVVVAVLALMGAWLVIRHRKKREHSEFDQQVDDELLQNIISFLQSQQGRTTQKEIRKQFSYSEAKISLALSQLEHEGRIKKLKKGRGNIIILHG
ncbi:hypothetical protein GF342_02785 [Candidatus Woesearchaeota archaeon]|nr:hypothetical protein [Candidatus Woesearchaeota archaeon]